MVMVGLQVVKVMVRFGVMVSVGVGVSVKTSEAKVCIFQNVDSLRTAIKNIDSQNDTEPRRTTRNNTDARSAVVFFISPANRCTLEPAVYVCHGENIGLNIIRYQNSI
jgi:hypothetical protein